MILDDIADGARLIVEGAPALTPKFSAMVNPARSRHGPVPDGSRKAFAKRKEEHVVHGPLAEVVVDAEDPRLVEGASSVQVQRPAPSEIVPNGSR